MKNLRILATTAGPFKQGDVIPAYALSNADWQVEEGFAVRTDDPATVDVSADDLAKSAPDASGDLIKSHAQALETLKSQEDTIDQLHKKCIDLELKNEALTKELGAKTTELSEAKNARDKYAVDLELANQKIEKLAAENKDYETLLNDTGK